MAEHVKIYRWKICYMVGGDPFVQKSVYPYFSEKDAYAFMGRAIHELTVNEGLVILSASVYWDWKDEPKDKTVYICD